MKDSNVIGLIGELRASSSHGKKTVQTLITSSSNICVLHQPAPLQQLLQHHRGQWVFHYSLLLVLNPCNVTPLDGWSPKVDLKGGGPTVKFPEISWNRSSRLLRLSLVQFIELICRRVSTVKQATFLSQCHWLLALNGRIVAIQVEILKDILTTYSW